MGMVKEVFYDHTLDRKPLHSNIFWTTAMNPLQAVENREFQVMNMHSSLKSTVMDYGDLTTDQEKVLLRHHLSEHSLGAERTGLSQQNAHMVGDLLMETILYSQHFSEKPTSIASVPAFATCCALFGSSSSSRRKTTKR